MGANNGWQAVKIQQREKINCAELAIDCGRSADSCADCQIRV
jgi:hypothetical protein